MGVRDPGNKPTSNDRIKRLHKCKGKVDKQGDRIEHQDLLEKII